MSDPIVSFLGIALSIIGIGATVFFATRKKPTRFEDKDVIVNQTTNSDSSYKGRNDDSYNILDLVNDKDFRDLLEHYRQNKTTRPSAGDVARIIKYAGWEDTACLELSELFVKSLDAIGLSRMHAMAMILSEMGSHAGLLLSEFSNAATPLRGGYIAVLSNSKGRIQLSSIEKFDVKKNNESYWHEAIVYYLRCKGSSHRKSTNVSNSVEQFFKKSELAKVYLLHSELVKAIDGYVLSAKSDQSAAMMRMRMRDAISDFHDSYADLKAEWNTKDAQKFIVSAELILSFSHKILLGDSSLESASYIGD